MIGVLLPTLKEEWELTNLHLAALGSLTHVGMLFGAIILGRMSDRVGRQYVFQLSLFISSLFGFASAFSPSIYWFIALRTILGFGYGGNIVTDTVLLAEFLPVKNRGRWLTGMEIFYGVGAICSVALAWLIIPNQALGWRYLIAFSSIPSFILIFLRRNIPESPRFLLMHHRHDDAVEVLKHVAQANKIPESHIDAIAKTKLYIHVHDIPEDSLDRFVDLLKNPVLRFITITLILIWFTSAFGGSLFMWVPLYLSERQQSEGKNVGDEYVAAMVMACGELLGGVSLAVFIEQFDRRNILRFFLLCLAIMSFVIGIIPDAGTIFFILPFISALRGATTSVLYTYTPEVYPTEVRTSGLGLCSAAHRLAPAIAHWAMASLYTMSFFHATTIFSCVYLFSFSLALFLPYDTKGKSLALFYQRSIQDLHSKRD